MDFEICILGTYHVKYNKNASNRIFFEEDAETNAEKIQESIRFNILIDQKSIDQELNSYLNLSISLAARFTFRVTS